MARNRLCSKWQLTHTYDCVCLLLFYSSSVVDSAHDILRFLVSRQLIFTESAVCKMPRRRLAAAASMLGAP